MKFIMATEAQRLISISLTKIAASRCIRGGISLHKNLLVATVLQKARYIFMEEAFHMVHGHYINQGNSKFIEELHHEKYKEHQLRQNINDDENYESVLFADSESHLSSNVDFNQNLKNLNHINRKSIVNVKTLNCDTNNEKSYSSKQHDSSVKSPIEKVHLDLDNETKASRNINRKRCSLAFDTSTPKSKQTKVETKTTLISNENEGEELKTSQYQKSNNCNTKNITNSEDSLNKTISLNFLSNDLNSTNDIYLPTTNTTNLPISPKSSIDRITSIVSIFNFGNLKRSVSSPDLCSSSNHCSVDCCNLQQHQIAMTV